MKNTKVSIKLVSADFIPLSVLLESWVDDDAKFACILSTNGSPILGFELRHDLIEQFKIEGVDLVKNEGYAEHGSLL